MDWWIYPLIGALGGFTAGLLGVGGGVIYTPILMLVLQNPIQAIATSLASMTLPTALSSWMHFREQKVDLRIYRKLFPGLLIGSFLGAYLAREAPQEFLRAFFGAFSLLISLFFVIGVKKLDVEPHNMQKSATLFLFGLSVSTLASFLGIGGGIIATIAYFLMGYSIKSVLGVTSVMSLSITSIAVLPLLNDVNWFAFLLIFPFGTMFAWLGFKLSKKIHGNYLEKILGAFLFVTGLVLLEPILHKYFSDLMS
jgi:uncharacterized membrane protein YfcA